MGDSRRRIDELTAELEELRSSAERYRLLVEHTSDLVAETDAEGRVLFLSPSCRDVLGFEPQELIGTTPFSLLHPDDVEPLAERFLDRVVQRRRRGAGRLFRIRHRDGSWRWLHGGGTSYVTPQGEPRVVAVCQDVTDRIRAAEDSFALRERLQKAQKLESLGMLAAGVAHDFNNLLTPILGSASLALMDLGDSPVRETLEKLQRAALQAATLTHQLLDYAGLGSVDAEPVDVSKTISAMSELLRSVASKRADLVLELAPDLPSVEGDPAQLSQLVLSLVGNASDAVEAAGGGRIRVRTRWVDVDRSRLAQMLLGDDLPAGRYVSIEVADDGRGMDAETRARLFDPFFTPGRGGRSLGLAAVVGIVRKHGGAIELRGAADRGTRIRVLLPVSNDARSDAKPPTETDWQGHGTVLVADDDEGALDLLADVLERTGFHVLRAADGSEAVETFRSRADEIRLVLLDRTMPGASGEEALSAIRELRTRVPAVIVSGYVERSEVAKSDHHHTSFLHKPFLPETLVSTVRSLLGE